MTGLNPYSIGRYSMRTVVVTIVARVMGLNPYSIGRYSMRWQKLAFRLSSVTGLNPYSNGI